MKTKHVLVFLSIVIIAVIFWLLFLAVQNNPRAVAQRDCIAYGADTNRAVKFVVLPSRQTLCLTPTAGGKWLPINQIGGVDGQ